MGFGRPLAHPGSLQAFASGPVPVGGYPFLRVRSIVMWPASVSARLFRTAHLTYIESRGRLRPVDRRYDINDHGSPAREVELPLPKVAQPVNGSHGPDSQEQRRVFLISKRTALPLSPPVLSYEMARVSEYTGHFRQNVSTEI